jgi:hypothetical protein
MVHLKRGMMFGRPCPSYVPTMKTGVGNTMVSAPIDLFMGSLQ